LESLINDLTIVTGVVMIVQIIQVRTLDLGQIGVMVVEPLAIAILFGGIFTYLWINILWNYYKDKDLTYVFTLGMLFILYSLVEWLDGNGAIAVLVLSLSLGNISLILKRFPKKAKAQKNLIERLNQISEYVRNTQVNFSFFIKNFFFVYLGIIFDLDKTSYRLVLICFAILIMMLLSRFISFKIFTFFESNLKQYTLMVTLMVARGFTATFAALFPSTKGIEIPQLNEITLLMVILSTFTTIFGSIIYEMRTKKRKKKKK
jgi:NhaP-type Na+/H+ or K+/H+ antiporter